jgi:hypothetical protein
MTVTTELRTRERIRHKTRILLDNFISNCCYEAKMLNYSSDGMYFESDYAPLPGSEVSIGIKKSPYGSGADIYRAQVRWRKNLPQTSKYAYGVGVRYCQPIAD